MNHEKGKPMALVTNCTYGSGLMVTRTLAHAGYGVFNVDVYRFFLALQSRFATGTYKLRDAGPAELGAELVGLVRRLRPAFVLPIDSNFAAAVSASQVELEALTCLNVPSAESFQIAFDKARCIPRCQALGIPCARLLSGPEAEALLEKDGSATVVVKPAHDVGAAMGVRYIKDVRALREHVAYLNERVGRCVIQEFTPGGHGSMRTVVVLFSRRSELVAAFTMRKSLEWPLSGGLTASGHSTDDPDLVKLVLPFFESCHWKGCAEVELRVDARDGRPKVIEINPRYPGYIDFVRRAGLDMASLSARLAQGEPVEPLRYPAYRPGTKMWNPFLFARIAAHKIRFGSTESPPFTQLRDEQRGGETDLALLAADPGALAGRCLRQLRAMLRP